MTPTDIEQGTEHPVTYGEVNQRLKFLSVASDRANVGFEKARNALAQADDALDKARRKLLLSDECPKVRRNGWTVAERDAWVDSRCETENTTYVFAKAAFDTATSTVFAVKDQISAAQTASSNLRTEMTMLGGGGPR